MSDKTIRAADPAEVTPESVAALLGDEDTMGILDRYVVHPFTITEKLHVVAWRCDEGCGGGRGHVGIVLRSRDDDDRINQTIAALARDALRHAEDEHGECYGGLG